MIKLTSLKATMRRVVGALYGEVEALSLPLELFRIRSSLLSRTSPEQRAKWMAQAGFRVGQGTRITNTPHITGGKHLFEHLVIGEDCFIDAGCVFDLEEKITLGDRVTLGPEAMILTSTHLLGPRSHRAGDVTRSPVVVQDGVWIQARAIVLPGVTIGVGAIVEVGAVVNKDVAAHTRVSGIPAVAVETLTVP